jgi:hypothetical protein
MGEFMCIQLVSRAAALAGCCSATFLLIGVATSASTSPTHQSLASSTTVERAGKADPLKHIEVSAGTNVAIAVELRGASDIVIRDRDGNILFAVDQSARTTTVGKQRRQRASSPPTVERALPHGCEGAFSPYAEPARAHVIGRCVSSVFPGTNALA